ncbi:isoaspartyl peptidase/L-asparaginase family protein [Sphingomonas sp. R1]|uniref:isoaspartyl peptidase/L-asparaginase family protein n=1 Tax=Sphingomonas sp. R1 TaxID=399176 RepID=UPI002224FB22|nr:isoaspartyl peptidase/L-asparaginase [Sphingomonas sp. R1]UYY75919.1 isoaspartyl peptidase/L-asparaginase [Sphingomonas sp. R1]
MSTQFSKCRWTLAIHGGAGSMRRGELAEAQEAGATAGLNAALDAGAAVLETGGSAVEAVQAAVQVLEDDPHFNAGRGSVFTWEGGHTLDAAIMDGASRAAGAVAGSTTTRHPVALARAVMEKSVHVLLAGEGADQFSRDQGLEQVDNAWFGTEERRQQLDWMKADTARGGFDVDMKYGTVGAVAMDAAGHVAAATSTGGLTGKRWGRVGDSPLIGAGTYADDRACAISATGSGEFFIREGVTHEICARMRFLGETAGQAAAVVMADVKAMGGVGGVILAAPSGELDWCFTTPGMYRGKAWADGTREIAIYEDQR